MRTLVLISALCVLAAPLGACNTVEGFGRDMESAGQKVQDL